MMKLERMVGWLLLGASLALVAGCKRSQSPEQPGEPPAAQPSAALPPGRPARANAPQPAAPGEVPVEIPRPAEPKVDWRALLQQLGPSSLIVFQEANDHCEWSVVEPPEPEGRPFLATHVCPSSLVWDRR